MGEHVVARAADIGDGERVVIEVDGASIGIFRVGDEFYALRNHCVHQGGPVCQGKITAPLRAEWRPGRVREYYDHALPIVTCPWHGWEYDVKTGVCLADRRRRIRSYPAKVVDGDIVIEA